MKKETKKPFPKKAKLITDGGFYKILPISSFDARIKISLMKRITVMSPETGVIDMAPVFDVTFRFVGVHGGYAEYRQEGIVSIVK